MRSHIRSTLLQAVAPLFVIVGVLFLADGLLPLRSHAGNPSWEEILIGAGLLFIGWVVRKAARKRSEQERP